MSIYEHDHDATTPDISTLVADAYRVNIIRALLVRIEGHNPVLLGDALDACRDRLRRDGSHHEIEMRRITSRHRDLARGIAHLAGVDSDLAEQVFLPSRSSLIVEELRDFIRQHRIGGGR